MAVQLCDVGRQIAILRKRKGLTQNELGERLHVSFQAVSKWERGEALPDTGILPDLANVLETTIDAILIGSERVTQYKRRITIAQMREGIECIERMGELLGRESYFYIGAVDGINAKMNMDIEAALEDEYLIEALIAEAAIQSMAFGAYVDISDIRKEFRHEHFMKIVEERAAKRGMV